MISAKPFDSAPNAPPSRAETASSTAMPPTPPGKVAPTSNAKPTMMTDWIRTTTASLTSRPRISASRRTGDTRKRSVTPLLRSSISAIPLQPEENSADMATTPGTRKPMYEPWA